MPVRIGSQTKFATVGRGHEGSDVYHLLEIGWQHKITDGDSSSNFNTHCPTGWRLLFQPTKMRYIENSFGDMTRCNESLPLNLIMTSYQSHIFDVITHGSDHICRQIWGQLIMHYVRAWYYLWRHASRNSNGDLIYDVVARTIRHYQQGPDSIQRWRLTNIGNPIVEIRRTYTGNKLSLYWMRALLCACYIYKILQQLCLMADFTDSPHSCRCLGDAWSIALF